MPRTAERILKYALPPVVGPRPDRAVVVVCAGTRTERGGARVARELEVLEVLETVRGLSEVCDKSGSNRFAFPADVELDRTGIRQDLRKQCQAPLRRLPIRPRRRPPLRRTILVQTSRFDPHYLLTSSLLQSKQTVPHSTIGLKSCKSFKLSRGRYSSSYCPPGLFRYVITALKVNDLGVTRV